MRRVFLATLVALFAVACTGNDAQPLSAPGEPAAQELSQHRGMLPATLTPAEQLAITAKRLTGKADETDTLRSDHPEWFSITEPPTRRGVRPMVEWEPMASNGLVYNESVAADDAIKSSMIDIAVATLDYGALTLIYDTETMHDDFVERMVEAGVSTRKIASQVSFVQMRTDSIWYIDFGPLPIVDLEANTLAFLDWRYYPTRVWDDAVPTRLAEELGVSTYRMPFDIEGGNFQAGDDGVCYTTQRAFTRMGGTEAELSSLMRYYAGCQELVVLRDIHNDGTGHIDMFFKLISTDAAIVGSFTAAQDSRAKTDMDWNAAQLEARGMTVYRMPMPNPGYWGVEAIPRTYLNSTLFNGPQGKVNLWPVYTADREIQAAALVVWEEALPDWDHVPINSDELSLMSGAVHCITRTIPALPLEKWVADGVCQDRRCAAAAGAYSGACEGDDQCFGPEWVCRSAYCAFQPCEADEDCVADAPPCSTSTCDNGVCLHESTCADGEECVDDACKAPQPCEAAEECDDEDECTDDACTDGVCVHTPIPDCGCVPECGDRVCGDDGCGGACGVCDEGHVCEVGACVPETPSCATDEDCAPSADLCVPVVCDAGACVAKDVECPAGESCDPATGQCVGGGDPCAACAPGQACVAGECLDDCAGIPFMGCCDGNLAVYCHPEGGLVIDECPAEAPVCTWTGDQNGYYCAAEDNGNDPSGVFPRECVTYLRCETDDHCDDGDMCTADTCVEGECQSAPIPDCVCEPDCSGLQCGLDPQCGMVCGVCDDGLTCIEGQCASDPNEICGEMPEEGCCDDATVVWCEEGVLQSIDCSQDGNPCGWSDEAGFFDCNGAGVVPPGVTPNCPGGPAPCAQDSDCDDGIPCTADACVQGYCANGEIENCCVDVADCDDRDPCTTDSCTGAQCQHEAVAGCTCSDDLCDDGDDCTADACDGDLCVHSYIPGCCTTDGHCNDAEDCTEDSCVDGACVHEPIMGCGIDCQSPADCDDGEICTAEQCSATGVCSYAPVPGCCHGDDECEDGLLCTSDACVNNQCVHEPRVCEQEGWQCNPNNGTCEPPCVPDCVNRECGDNGCGGVCGGCPAGEECNERGKCENRCEYACLGLECGSPDADCPPCGQCDPGFICGPIYQCDPDPNYEPDTGQPAEPDTSGPADVIADAGDSDGGGGGGGGGCDATGSGAPLGAPLTFFALLLGLATLRRRALRG